jgi:hypothetical protein
VADPDGTGPLAAVIASTNGQGVFVPAGTANTGVVVNLAGTTAISGFSTGVESNDGSLAVTGTVNVSGNQQEGFALWGTNDTTTTTVTITGATVQGNGGDGIDVRSTVPVTVTGSTIRNNTESGVEVLSSQNTTEMGYRFLLTGGTVSGNWERGVELSQQIGKVGARVEGVAISGNGLEGVRISDEIPGAPVTEVLMEDNTISGNLTRSATADANITAGGVFFAMHRNAAGTAQNAASTPTRVSLGNFIGNSVFRNGRSEIGFDITQEGGAAWDLSSESPAVDQAMVCSTAAKPNKVYCYDTVPGEDLGVSVIPTTIPIKIKGMSFQTLPPTGGRDFSSGVPQPTVLTPEPTTGVFLSCTATVCPP